VKIDEKDNELLEDEQNEFDNEFDGEQSEGDNQAEVIVTAEEQARRDRVFEEELLPQIDSLYTFAYHLVYNEDDANDLVQEAYLKAYRFIHKYQPGTNAEAWLYRILKNAFINQYRKKSRQPHKVDLEDFIIYHDGQGEGGSAGYSDLRQDIFESMMGDEVTIAINKLPPDFKIVILLCDIEGFTYEEISKIVNIPIGTVRSRLHRARNMLKEQLREYAKSMGFEDKRK
jgi:RNA polymerase sigma factor (sigma-70 family)